MSVLKSKEMTKDKRCWYFKVSINGKQFKSKKYATKKEALKEESDFILAHQNKDLVADKITFSDAIREYLEHEKQVVKQSTYRQEVKLCEHINSSLGDIVIEQLKVNDYKQFRQTLVNKGFSVGYCNKILNHTKSIIKLMYVRYGVTTRVPDGFTALKDNSIKTEVDFYSPDEFEQFIGCIDRLLEMKWYCFFLVSYYCGTRCGENNALQWKDIDFEARTISINKTVNTKIKDKDGNYLIGSPKTKGSYRVLPMANKVYKALTRLKAFYERFDGFNDSWFVYGGIKPISETNIHKYNRIFAERSGLRPITIHGFRHSCCSYLLSKNCSILMVAKYLGHSDTQKALNVYGHLMPNQLKVASSFFDMLD